jgi:hypothetical protein
VDVLVELVPAPAEEAVPVLRRHRGAAEVVVLHRGDADDLRHADEGPPEEGPACDVGGSGGFHEAEVGGGRQVDLGTGVDRGALDAAPREAGGGRLDRVVGDAHLGGACLAAEPHERGDDLRVRRGAERRRPLERHVRLHEDDVPRPDEPPDAADAVDGAPQHLLEPAAAGDAEVREDVGSLDGEPPSGRRSDFSRGLPRSPSGSFSESGQPVGARET